MMLHETGFQLPPAPPFEDFWTNVIITDACWTWTGITVDGYARYKGVGAHRISYEWNIGPIPPGLDVDHECLNRGCVRPGHLRLATRKQNMENRTGPKADSPSGIRGVGWCKRSRRWRALVTHHGKQHHCGYFADKELAGIAAKAKRDELFTHSQN